jgi:predicted SnoaL-like aldol condensation-catalyzing enzyme
MPAPPDARSIEAMNVPASRLDSNKQTVLAFYEIAMNNKDSEGASHLIGRRYIQHDPGIADGVDGLNDFIDYLRETFPELRADVKRIFTDGDFVIAHVHRVRVPGHRGSALVDIFRLENGRIVEHWGVSEPVPDQAENANGMF